MSSQDPTPRQSPLARFEQFGLQLRQLLDQAQGTIPRLNQQISELHEAGLLPATFLLGNGFYQEAYQDEPNSDSGVAYQATLSIPGGFGAAFWNSEEYAFEGARPSQDVQDVAARNIRFEDLPPRVQARLVSQVTPLMEELLAELGVGQLPRE